jgi:hypothetical protein
MVVTADIRIVGIIDGDDPAMHLRYSLNPRTPSSTLSRKSFATGKMASVCVTRIENGTRAMCLSLTIKIFGTSLFFQGCVNAEPTSWPSKVEPPAPPVVTEDWAPMVAKADAEEDGSLTFLFRDFSGRIRPAVATCVDSTPNEREGEVRIKQIKHKDLTVYSVSCAETPKVM